MVVKCPYALVAFTWEYNAPSSHLDCRGHIRFVRVTSRISVRIWRHFAFISVEEKGKRGNHFVKQLVAANLKDKILYIHQ